MSYNYSGTVTVGIWAKKSAGWQKVTTDIAIVYGGDYSTGEARDFNWSIADRPYQLGSGVQAAGVTIEDHSGFAANLTFFNELSWQAQSASGTRSATPNGQKTTVIVSP